MSLLTPSESRAFQSFLDAAAFPLPADWNMQLEISHEHMPPARGTEALTKATKDLMSLDGDKWRYPLGPYAPGESPVTPAHRQHNSPLALLYPTRQQRSLASNADEAEPSSPLPAHLGPSTSHTPPAKRSPPPQNRVSLLSPSQKKANHIQSEQKRRANIRRGYDTLCETVPALREACQAEDEQQLADGKPKGRRRGKGKARNDDGERIDGRAGPRSENVVLSKTIDYVQELHSERDALMQRLCAARAALPADHPLLHPPPDAPLPLWERKWTGGEKVDDDEDDDDDD